MSLAPHCFPKLILGHGHLMLGCHLSVTAVSGSELSWA
jgi:hypothetical protein